MLRLVTATTAAIALLIASVGDMTADNWGAGAIQGSSHRCTEYPDYESECTANNLTHIVYISSSVPPPLDAALENSLEGDYDDPLSEVVASVTSDPGASADVSIYYALLPSSWPSAFTTCSTSATYGAQGYNRWCRPQWLYYDSAEYYDCWSVWPCRGWLSCHELGHTFGLQHANSQNHPNPSNTCMSYSGAVVLRQHDRNHLINCYPHPSGSARPPDCVEND